MIHNDFKMIYVAKINLRVRYMYPIFFYDNLSVCDKWSYHHPSNTKYVKTNTKDNQLYTDQL